MPFEQHLKCKSKCRNMSECTNDEWIELKSLPSKATLGFDSVDDRWLTDLLTD